MMIKVLLIVALLQCYWIPITCIMLSSILPNSIKELYNNKLKNSTVLHDITTTGRKGFGINLNFGSINIFDDRHPVHDSLSKISSADLQQAYLKCFNTLTLTKTQLLLKGFKQIHQSTQENFLLYKKKVKEKVSAKYRVIYLMIGEFDDISPRSFLNAQFDPLLRQRWDITCKDMRTEGADSLTRLVKGDKESCDEIYYRTRWPWPLKDRDYVLARRVRHFNDKNALVLISKSTDSKLYPSKVDNVIRVDRYWCKSVVFATRGSVDKQGMKFVTYFCDDQQVQLPNKLIDLLCRAGEKVVPESMASLHRVAQSTNNNI